MSPATETGRDSRARGRRRALALASLVCAGTLTTACTGMGGTQPSAGDGSAMEIWWQEDWLRWADEQASSAYEQGRSDADVLVGVSYPQLARSFDGPLRIGDRVIRESPYWHELLAARLGSGADVRALLAQGGEKDARFADSLVGHVQTKRLHGLRLLILETRFLRALVQGDHERARKWARSIAGSYGTSTELLRRRKFYIDFYNEPTRQERKVLPRGPDRDLTIQLLPHLPRESTRSWIATFVPTDADWMPRREKSAADVDLGAIE